ncbi:MAG: response regulator transcription factor [Flavobacteriales bacterium]|nr:response regulator transcription factor [Flavobacteriales bacterium]
MKQSPTILLVDDHRLVMDGLRAVLEGHGMKVVGTASHGAEALAIARRAHPDLVLLDVHMPGPSGLEVGVQLKAERPDIRVVILSMHNSAALVRQVKQRGLDGYLLKNVSAEELLTALHAVLGGALWFPGLEEADRSQRDDPAQQLTPREMEVLRCIAQGASNQDMSDQLGITPRTVETHRKNLNQKLGTTKVSDLVHVAQRLGLV